MAELLDLGKTQGASLSLRPLEAVMDAAARMRGLDMTVLVTA